MRLGVSHFFSRQEESGMSTNWCRLWCGVGGRRIGRGQTRDAFVPRCIPSLSRQRRARTWVASAASGRSICRSCHGAVRGGMVLGKKRSKNLELRLWRKAARKGVRDEGRSLVLWVCTLLYACVILTQILRLMWVACKAMQDGGKCDASILILVCS